MAIRGSSCFRDRVATMLKDRKTMTNKMSTAENFWRS